MTLSIISGHFLQLFLWEVGTYLLKFIVPQLGSGAENRFSGGTGS